MELGVITIVIQVPPESVYILTQFPDYRIECYLDKEGLFLYISISIDCRYRVEKIQTKVLENQWRTTKRSLYFPKRLNRLQAIKKIIKHSLIFRVHH